MLERFKDSKDFRMNVLYVVAQGLYWMMVCCAVSMGNAYLSNSGFKTFSIGFLFAIAYLFAAVVQQALSILTDTATKFDVVDILAILGAILSIDLLIALLTDSKGFLIGFTFFIGAMVATVIQPFLNALNFHIEGYKVQMNYGVARASGSFFFFLMSLIVGLFMKTVSEKAAPFFGFLVSVAFTAVIICIYRELKNLGEGSSNDYDPFEATTGEALDILNVREFVEQYKMFFLFLIGVVCFFFGHIVINNFFYKIAVSVGGDEGTNGALIALGAIVELPAMIFFNKLKEKFDTRLLLGVSAVFFFIKIFITAMASSVGLLYFSMLFQSLGFALFIPASVHFVDEVMPKKDAVKGQAFVTIATTISSLLGSVLGGLFMEWFGCSATLGFAAVVTFVGVIVAIIGLVRINIQK